MFYVGKAFDMNVMSMQKERLLCDCCKLWGMLGERGEGRL